MPHRAAPPLLALAGLLALTACGGDAPPADDRAAADVADTGADTGADLDADVTADAPEPDGGDLGLPDIPDAPDAGDGPPQGPGLGNLSYSDDELFTPVGWIDEASGAPMYDPEFLFTAVKPYGTNVALMHRGYLMALFAGDSGGGPGGLLFYDVSDPRDPQLAAMHYDPHGDTAEFREAHSIGMAEIDGTSVAAFHTGRGVEFWDVTDVRAPAPLGKVALEGVDFGDYRDVAWQLFWQGDYVYVAGSDAGVFIVDASDVRAPVLAERGEGRPNPVPTSELGGFRIGPVFAFGNLLVVSSMDTTGGFATLDLSDPVNPVLLDAITRGLPKFYATCFSGGRIVTSVRGSGARMGVYDARDPFRLSLVDESLVLDEMLYCAGQDEFIFQGGEDDVFKIDTTDGAFTLVGQGQLGRLNTDHGQVNPMGNLVFVGNDHGTGSALVPHQAEPDTRGPEVAHVNPADGATLQSRTTRVGLAFTDAVDVQSVVGDAIVVERQTRDGGWARVEGRFTYHAAMVSFAPAIPLEPASTYRIRVPAGGVRDWSGNPSARDFESTFSTADVALDGAGAPAVSLPPLGAIETGAPLTVRVGADATEGARFAWNFGDGSGWSEAGEAREATHTYAEPGHYAVGVRATNGRGWAAASRRLTVHDPVVAATSRSGTLATTASGDVWTVNRDNGSLSVVRFDGDVGSVQEIPLAATPTSVDSAGDSDVWVVTHDPPTLRRFDPETQAERSVIPLPDASRPAAVALDPGGAFVAVALEATAELALVDPSDEGVTRVPLDAAPGGVAVRRVDGVPEVFVSRAISSAEAGGVWRVTRVDDAWAVAGIALPLDDTTVDAEDRARGVPNLLTAPVASATSDDVWVGATQANVARGAYRDGQPLDFESTVRAVAARLIAPGDAVGEEVGARLDFNDRALPAAVALSPLGDWLLVVLQGSNEVQFVDAFSGALATSLTAVGAAPQDVLVSAADGRVYVHGYLSRTLHVFDATGFLAGAALDLRPITTVSLVSDEALAPDVLRGKRVFFNAADPRMSEDGYISCATCHPGGGHDGMTWDFTDRGEGLRNTIDLRGRAGLGHGPLHWTANFDEVQDFENDIRLAFGGAGFLDDDDWEAGTRSDPLGDAKAGLSRELDDLAAFVSSLSETPPSPHWEDGAPSAAAVRGEAVFTELNCGRCHTPPTYTDSGTLDTNDPTGPRYDVGTATEASGRRRGAFLDGFDAPTLLGVWATAPYLHDGSAATLIDMFDLTSSGAHGLAELEAGEVDDLMAFLRSL